MPDGEWVVPVARNNWNYVEVFYGQPELLDLLIEDRDRLSREVGHLRELAGKVS